MSEIPIAKRLIQEGKERVVFSGIHAHEMSGNLHDAKGGLATGAEALLGVIKGLRQVEDNFKSAADQGKGMLTNMTEAKKSFEAAGAASSPFEAIRNMPVDLNGCSEWVQPLVTELERQKGLSRLIGLLSTIHADITDDRFTKALNKGLEMTNRVENQVIPEIEGRADTWNEML